MAASPALTAISPEPVASAASAWGSGAHGIAPAQAGGPADGGAKPGQAQRPDIDQRLLAAWHRYCGLRETARRTRRQANLARAELAALLVEKRDLMVRAPTGFDGWLRLHDIPRSTAYHLIGLHLNGGLVKKTKAQTVSNLDTPLNSVQLDGQVMSLRLALTPRQAAVIASSLAALDEAQHQPGAKPFDLGEHLATSLAAATAGAARTQIQRLRRLPDSSFPAAPAAHPPIRFCPTPPVAAAAPISRSFSNDFNHLQTKMSTNLQSPKSLPPLQRPPSSQSRWQLTTDDLRDNLHALTFSDQLDSPANWSFRNLIAATLPSVHVAQAESG